MNKQEKLTAPFTHLYSYGCAGLLTLLCIAVPMGTASGQELVPDAYGTVTCEQIDNNEVVTTVTYNVSYYYPTNTVSNRWNDGLNFAYKWGFGFMQKSRNFTSYTVYFHQESIDTVNNEDFFAEAGKWQIRVDRNNAMSITGRSFVVKDIGTPLFSGDCTWNLKGTMPTG